MRDPTVEVYLRKAEDCLAGAASEYANGRFDNCANRAYYAGFQAAVAALLREGIRPSGQTARWGHDFVQARFVGDLINRRKLYPATIRDVLFRGMELRQTADYRAERVSAIQAFRQVARARAFVDAVTAKGAPK
jgi:uncharacterized protein (UPF0332 family)